MNIYKFDVDNEDIFQHLQKRLYDSFPELEWLYDGKGKFKLSEKPWVKQSGVAISMVESLGETKLRLFNGSNSSLNAVLMSSEMYGEVVPLAASSLYSAAVIKAMKKDFGMIPPEKKKRITLSNGFIHIKGKIIRLSEVAEFNNSHIGISISYNNGETKEIYLCDSETCEGYWLELREVLELD